MCGIIGYVGKNSAVPYLISSLERLEYRGYDSAGICVFDKGTLKNIKAEGRLENLKNLLAKDEQSSSKIGIGHTRWATHGKPSDVNSHPHMSQNAIFSVVHNGIIENYAELKQRLMSEDVNFVSDTDTEVIAHLLEKNYDGDLLGCIAKTTAELEGSFALGIMCSDFPNVLACTRYASPLVVGESENSKFICSDITAILPYTKEFYTLEPHDICLLEGENVKFYDSKKKLVSRQKNKVDWTVNDAQKGGYEHFMLKEIMEQPNAIHDTISPRIKDGKIDFEGINLTAEKLKTFNKIFIVACGSAYHVGVIGKYVIEKMCHISVEVDIASEFRYRQPIVDEKTLCIIISQSGETADTLAALRTAKELGAYVLSLVNVVSSSIANESDDVLYTWAGPEIAVATTKAYSTQVSLLYLFAGFLAKETGWINEGGLSEFLSEVEKLPQEIEMILSINHEKIKELSHIFTPLDHAYFIGRNLDYAVALEASLKMKEISYIHSEAYGAGELKHGTISLIEEGTLVVALACNDDVFYKTISSVKEVVARGAKILIVTTKKHENEVKEFDFSLILQDKNPLLMPSLEVVPMQLLSYYTSKYRGCDIDKPRNLAKSVTVE